MVLVVDQLVKAMPVLSRSAASTSSPRAFEQPGERRRGPRKSSARWSSRSLVSLLAFPLEGSARPSTSRSTRRTTGFTRLLVLNIRNLSGVPSVVYGLLGLTVFVGVLAALGVGDGRNLISGSRQTLMVLVLPIVIITSSEALRAIPSSNSRGGLRDRGVAGWQVVAQVAAPRGASPGILTRDRPGVVASPRSGCARRPRRGRPHPDEDGEPQEPVDDRGNPGQVPDVEDQEPGETGCPARILRLGSVVTRPREGGRRGAA